MLDMNKTMFYARPCRVSDYPC